MGFLYCLIWPTHHYTTVAVAIGERLNQPITNAGLIILFHRIRNATTKPGISKMRVKKLLS